MAYIQTLYSGSSGNCTLVRDGGTAVLVDMGKNCKQTLEALYTAGVSAADLSGILITHEHVDHVYGLNVFLKHYGVPVFGSGATLEYLYNHLLVPEHADLIPLEPKTEMMLGEMTFSGFRTSHDSADCFGYRFLFGNRKTAAVATDLGYVSDSVRESLSGCDFVGLESNYDEGMLRFGKYPLYLKQRIASRMGHLSNCDCSETIVGLASAGTAKFALMHLSNENNAPEIALTTCLGMLENGEVSQCNVKVAPRHSVGEAVEI